jgi:hypothetical protein
MQGLVDAGWLRDPGTLIEVSGATGIRSSPLDRAFALSLRFYGDLSSLYANILLQYSRKWGANNSW